MNSVNTPLILLKKRLQTVNRTARKANLTIKVAHVTFKTKPVNVMCAQ